ncbi:MAG: ferritin family protein [Marinifilaceae bacterium]|jgi:rubrerythrin
MMKIFRTFEEILDFAIDRESAEVDFYMELSQQVKQKNVGELFQNIALEKTAHMLKLEQMKDLGDSFPMDQVPDLKIAGRLEEVDVNKKDLDYQDALIIAMKREKNNFKFYLQMAERAENEECRITFLALANEVARQKLRFEIEYDENILQEN